MNNIFKTRRTIRKFKRAAVSADRLLCYIDAARLAPYAANIQFLRYFPVCDSKTADALFPLCRFAGYLKNEDKTTFEQRPAAYIAVFSDTSVADNHMQISEGTAMAAIAYAAEADNMGCCILKAIDFDKITQLLGTDEKYKLLFLAALGEKDEKSKAVEATDGIKYFLDEENILNVPKLSMQDIILHGSSTCD